MFRRSLVTAVLLLGVVLYVPDSCAITIGPDRLEVRLPPREVAGIDYYAQNETDAPIHVVVELENWAEKTYNYGNLAIKSWITLDCYEFDLKPMEIKKLKLTVRVPGDAKGEIAAQIFFTSSAVKGSGSSVRARLGAVLYVAVKGTEIVKTGIKNVDFFDIPDKNSVKIDMIVRNDGNVHMRPGSGHVLIEDEKGQRIVLKEIATERSVLPNQESAYTVLLDKSMLKEGKYRVSCEIKYGKMYGREKTAKLEKGLRVDNAGKVTVE